MWVRAAVRRAKKKSGIVTQNIILLILLQKQNIQKQKNELT